MVNQRNLKSVIVRQTLDQVHTRKTASHHYDLFLHLLHFNSIWSLRHTSALLPKKTAADLPIPYAAKVVMTTSFQVIALSRTYSI